MVAEFLEHINIMDTSMSIHVTVGLSLNEKHSSTFFASFSITSAHYSQIY